MVGIISPPKIFAIRIMKKSLRANRLNSPAKKKKKLSAMLCSKPDSTNVIIEINIAKYLPT